VGSILKWRKKKMSKHKYRKMREKTKALRKK
jgi:hypothetical protein